MRLVWSTVEITRHQNRQVSSVLLPVQFQKAQNFPDLPHTYDAEVRLMWKEKMRVDHDYFSAFILLVRCCASQIDQRSLSKDACYSIFSTCLPCVMLLLHNRGQRKDGVENHTAISVTPGREWLAETSETLVFRED